MREKEKEKKETIVNQCRKKKTNEISTNMLFNFVDYLKNLLITKSYSN